MKHLLLFLVLCLPGFSQGWNIAAPNWNPVVVTRTPGNTNVPTAAQIRFTYTLGVSANTSAGVYDTNSVLVRTLWGGNYLKSGTYTELWDGKDNYGNLVTTCSTGCFANYQPPYTIKVLYNNVQYTWDGVVGNTEDDPLSPNSWEPSSWRFPTQLAFVDGVGYAATGYSENSAIAMQFPINKPNSPSIINPFLYDANATSKTIECAATDGILIYFCVQTSKSQSFVLGVYPGGQVAGFTSGTVLESNSFGQSFFNSYLRVSAVDVNGTAGSPTKPTRQPTGVAVQTGGNILAVSHGAIFSTSSPVASSDQVSLFNKTTGAALSNITITNPQFLAFSPAGDLWVVGGVTSSVLSQTSPTVLSRITGVGTTNVITTPIAGLSRPIQVAFNQSTGHMYVADGGASQQVKEYDGSLNLVNTYGDLGGYQNCDPLVTKTKLMFDGFMTGVIFPNNAQTDPVWAGGGVAVDNTGGIWITDAADMRILHLDSSYHWINQIAYLPTNYETAVNHSDPTRVFDYLREYKIDYSKPMTGGDPDPASGGNGAWTLYRNWNACAPTNTLSGFKYVETFSNGRTFAFGFSNIQGTTGQLVELPSTGAAVAGTYPFASASIKAMLPNGYASDATRTIASGLTTSIYHTYPVVSFNPTTGFPVYDQTCGIIACVTASWVSSNILGGPISSENWQPEVLATTGGYYPAYQGGVPNTTSAHLPPFHLGAVKAGATALTWRTHPGALIKYPDGLGTYTEVNAGGGQNGNGHHVVGTNIITQFNGQAQPYGNQYAHWYEDGLFIGQFGHRGLLSVSVGVPSFGKFGAPAGGAQTLHTFQMVAVGSDLYVYHGDEFQHKGVHRWHITGLDTVHEVGATGALGSTITLVSLF